MNENIYYMPIQSASLAHYFGRGLILSSRFYKNRPSDIQNLDSDYLVLSKNKLLNNSNCSIELVLNSEELKYLTDTEDNNIFLYSNPIPISRVKKVYFIDEIQKLKTIDNINRGTAFIPATLIEVIEEESINMNIIVKGTFEYSPELESRIKTYNHILGGLAFVKYTLEEKYAENYFSILSHFNNFIQNKINNRFDKYDGAFTHNGGSWGKLSPLLYETISEKDVLNFSKQEKVAIEKSNGIFKYEKINKESITYKLAILNIYGEDSSKRKKTDDLISDCKNDKISKEKQESIALIYGINHGYFKFRNQYDKKIVKFKMDSLLDYYTIESVFQYVINDKKNNEKFEHIDEIFPDEELVLDIEKKAFDLEEYLTNIFKYFTENMLNISMTELLNNIINQFKNTFIEELDKKDSELKKMKLKIEELNQEIDTKDNELQREKINIEELNKEKDERNNALTQNIADLNDKIIELNKSMEDKDKNINSLTKDIENQNGKIIELNKSIKDRKLIKSEQTLEDNKVTFDEEKERIIIEQTLTSCLEYANKKVPELKQIAKDKNIKYTTKLEVIKEIITKKDPRLDYEYSK